MASVRKDFTLIRIIAAYEIAGGIFGLLVVGQRVLAGHGGLLFIPYPAFMLYAGILLWRNQPKGFKFSARVQLIQIPIISVPYFVYVVGLPIFSWVSVAWGGGGEEWEVGLNFGFTLATLQFMLGNPDVSGRMLGIQPISLFMYLILRREPVELPRGSEDNRRIREEVLTSLKQESGPSAHVLSVTVDHGIVHISGIVDSESQRQSLRMAAEKIPGVRVVTDRLMLWKDLPVRG